MISLVPMQRPLLDGLTDVNFLNTSIVGDIFRELFFPGKDPNTPPHVYANHPERYYLPLQTTNTLRLVNRSFYKAFPKTFLFGLYAPDHIRCLFLLHKAAHDPSSMFDFGYEKLEGETIKPEPKKAYEWIRKAIDAGYIENYSLIAYMCLDGEGVKQNIKEAISYYKKGCKQNHLECFFILGLFNFEVKENFKRALHYFRKGASLGDQQCMFHLAVMYQFGLGMLRSNQRKARFWKDKAVAVGIWDTPEFVEALDLQYGKKKDLKKAAELYKEAAHYGHEIAEECLDCLKVAKVI